MTIHVDATERDADARRQIREMLDATLFVEAGAGTGKTAALVDRYLALVLGGRRVERVVAITFTEKAAAELKDRVRQGLETRLGAENTAPERRLIEEALAALDRAQISTIHAFCQTLLRSFAARAGIDPAFQVVDDVAAERRFEERWRAFLEQLGNDRGAIDVIDRALDLGLTTQRLQELAHELWRRSELAERLRGRPLLADGAGWPDLDALRDELSSIDTSLVPDDDALLKRINLTLSRIDELRNTPASEREVRLVALTAGLSVKLGGTGRAPNWRGSTSIAQVRDTVSQVHQALLDSVADLRSEALADLLPFVVRFVVEEARERRRDGRLVFDDLILGVRDVLHDDANARLAMRRRYDAILIDEFQDTDPLQAEIALAFAGLPESMPQAGRLFLVGDPKQSIYRFRRADMAIYARTQQTIVEAGARTLDLSLNRRSVPGILGWVNQVFESLIGNGSSVEVQPAYKDIDPFRADGGLEGPDVAWFGSALADPAGAIRQHEARHVAAYCREIVRQEWSVAERDGRVRAAQYRDIAILLPARTILQPLERALAAEGIPYRVEGGSLVYATQEVRDLINCLSAIDDPSDDVAVVAALRSPAYACSDVELALFRRNAGFNYLSPTLDQAEGRVAEGLRDLRARHLERGKGPLAAQVERLTTDRRLVEIGLLDSGNRNAFRRARFLVEQARAFESEGPESLRSFVEWLERRAGEAIYDHEGAGLDDDEDAVRVLTIHAAKGLEFPIVFLAGLGAPQRTSSITFGHDREDGSIAVQIGSQGRRFELGPIDRVREHEGLHEIAERVRLLYVAATRARDHLLVSLFHKRDAGTSLAARLLSAGAAEIAPALPPVELTATRPPSPLAGLEPEVEFEDESVFISERRRLLEDAHRRRYTSATALGRRAEASEAEDKDEQDDESEPWSRGRAGTHVGRAVHAALQTLAWDASEAEVAAVARAQAVAEAVPDEAERIARLIRSALASDAAQRARAARRALREVPFAFEEGRYIVEGFADLVIETDDGLEIVDWKTDQVPENAVETRLRNYETQAGLYVLGVERATRRQVTTVSYVFVSAGVERSPGTPSELAEAALERLQDA